MRQLGDDVLVEEYIAGRELTVAWLGGRSMPVVEIKPREGWYDYRHKYLGGTEYQCPAEISQTLAERLLRWTAELNTTLGCRGVTRTDYRLDLDEQPFCLELNTHSRDDRKQSGSQGRCRAGVGLSCPCEADG